LQLISKPHTGQCGKPEMISPDMCQCLTDCPVFATSANKNMTKYGIRQKSEPGHGIIIVIIEFLVRLLH